MSMRRLCRGLLALGALGLLIFGCVIEERKYDPDLVPPDDPIITLATDAQCRDYCKTVKTNCAGSYEVYLDEKDEDTEVDSDCMGVCKQLAPGKGPNDKSNSVECRRENAVRAASEPTEEACAGAGPGGNTLCGDTCETYCDLRTKVCGDPGLEGGDLDPDRCLLGCAALEPGKIYDTDPMAKGDTLQCRLNHLVFASRGPDAAKTHCWHTAVIPNRTSNKGDPPCADQPGTAGHCDAYCKLVTRSCTGANRVYASEAQCLKVCAAFPLGKAEETGSNPGENTVACRRYHAYAALGPDGPQYHCPHAGPSGDGHCGAPAEGDNCFSYCRILKLACTTRFFATHLPGQMPATPDANLDAEDLGDCETKCRQVPGNEPNSRYSVELAPSMDPNDDGNVGKFQGQKGDALQCRLFNAIQALSAPAGQVPDKECAAAFGDAGSPCFVSIPAQ